MTYFILSVCSSTLHFDRLHFYHPLNFFLSSKGDIEVIVKASQKFQTTIWFYFLWPQVWFFNILFFFLVLKSCKDQRQVVRARIIHNFHLRFSSAVFMQCNVFFKKTQKNLILNFVSYILSYIHKFNCSFLTFVCFLCIFPIVTLQ